MARLAELRPVPDESPVSPSNAATRAVDRTEALYEARRWDELEAAVSPDLVVEDRRALAQVTTDRAAWLESMPAVGRGERDATSYPPECFG